MTKNDIICRISEETGMTKKETGRLVEDVIKGITGSLCRGESVYLRGFGTFKVTVRAARTGRDIRRNTTVIVPAQRTVKYIPSQELAKAVAELKL